MQIKTMQVQISNLKRDNLQLMETIQPCPLPDQNLVTEIKTLEGVIKSLERNYTEEVESYREIIQLLGSDFENSCLQNEKLKNEIKLLSENKLSVLQNNGFVTPKRFAKPLNGSLLIEDQVDLSNQFELLQSDETTILQELSETAMTLQKNRPSDKTRVNRNRPNTFVSNSKINSRSKTNVLMISDSHGRDMYRNLAEIWPSADVNISVIYKPNAMLNEVVNDLEKLTRNYTKADTVIIVGGCNDDVVNHGEELIGKYKDIIGDTVHTQVVIAGLPHRYDVPGLNNHISFINMELEKIISQNEDTKFLPINTLPRHMYTKHGLHFNRTGKREFSKMIKNCIYQSLPELRPTPQQQFPLPQQGLPVSLGHRKSNDNSTSHHHHSSAPPLPSSGPLQQDPLVVPGVLTYSEVLKQSSGEVNCEESVADMESFSPLSPVRSATQMSDGTLSLPVHGDVSDTSTANGDQAPVVSSVTDIDILQSCDVADSLSLNPSLDFPQPPI